MFPLSRLYEILGELHRYQFQMANNTPPDSADFKEYIDIIYKYSQNVKDFSEIIKLLQGYNNRHYSNYNPQFEELHHEETY